MCVLVQEEAEANTLPSLAAVPTGRNEQRGSLLDGAAEPMTTPYVPFFFSAHPITGAGESGGAGASDVPQQRH